MNANANDVRIRHILRQTSHHCDRREQHHIFEANASFDEHEDLGHHNRYGDAIVNRFLHIIGIIGTMIMIICDIAEFLAVPALFIVIGLLNSYPWQYYAITIGGYIVLYIVVEIIALFVCKALDKKYTPLIEKKFEKYFNKFPNKG